MNQPFYIVHGFERTQSFIEDQHTVDVTILVVDIGGKDASIVRPYHNSRNLFTFLAPLVPIVEMVSGKTIVMPDDDIACRQGLYDDLPVVHHFQQELLKVNEFLLSEYIICIHQYDTFSFLTSFL